MSLSGGLSIDVSSMKGINTPYRSTIITYHVFSMRAEHTSSSSMMLTIRSPQH